MDDLTQLFFKSQQIEFYPLVKCWLKRQDNTIKHVSHIMLWNGVHPIVHEWKCNILNPVVPLQ